MLMKKFWFTLMIPVFLLSCAQNAEEKGQNSAKQDKQKDTDADIRASTLIEADESVPEYSFTTTAGEQYTMEELNGKVVLLNFFATWCPTCMDEMPALQNEVWEKYKDHEAFMLVSIGREQDMQKMKEFKSGKGYDWHFAPDTGRVMYSKFATKYIPRNVLVDPDGTIAYQNTGYTEEEFQILLERIELEMEKLQPE